MTDDVSALIRQAYALDREGREHEAIAYYDQAWQRGVPEAQRRNFVVGYGSTLRNVGRIDEAIGVLAQAVADDPGYPAFHAFLSLALLSAGRPQLALATMLQIVLEHMPEALDGYHRALGEYHQELIGQASAQP